MNPSLTPPTIAEANEVADSTVTDESLMAKIATEHSSQALEQLYRRHRGMLRGVVLRILRDEAEMEDVLQDVFIQVWNQSSNYSAEKGLVLGWLIVLARRRALDRLRQRSAYQRATDRFEAEHERHADEGGEHCHVEEDVCNNDLRGLMYSLISHLPPPQQQVVLLTYFEDMSQREIAAHLGLPLGTVKTRIELGVRKLGSALAPMRAKVA
ncbi:MAG: polymerase, sigma-24 subunit, subfamily [Verrucomicrobiaceae bacterium]|nr:polymerase, sigma-24 subunit, subfamily [Verrucomicrobiaceae bacterium]